MPPGEIPEHISTKRLNQRRSSESYPEGFDSDAKQKAERVSSMHEFRRQNIKEADPLEDPEKQFFDYDPDKETKRYDSLKLETIFRQ